jgi:hypothetical protein
MPPSLAEIQDALARSILGADVSPARPYASVPAGVDLDARLSAYTDGYPARILESLREVFPATAKILGESSFQALVGRYRHHVPAGWCNLGRIGERLATHLRTDPLTNELPFLPDLAQLEWAVIECFHAEQVEPFDVSQCGEWGMDDWARARIVFQPGTTIVSSEWPIRALRAARDLERTEIDVDLIDRPEHVWIHRRGLDVSTRCVDTTEAGALVRLLAGATLGEVMAELTSANAGPEAVVALFAGWASAGLVVDCQPG